MIPLEKNWGTCGILGIFYFLMSVLIMHIWKSIELSLYMCTFLNVSIYIYISEYCININILIYISEYIMLQYKKILGKKVTWDLIYISQVA